MSTDETQRKQDRQFEAATQLAVLEKLFDARCKLTLIVRDPESYADDVVLTKDDYNEAIRALVRARERGKGNKPYMTFQALRDDETQAVEDAINGRGGNMPRVDAYRYGVTKKNIRVRIIDPRNEPLDDIGRDQLWSQLMRKIDEQFPHLTFDFFLFAPSDLDDPRGLASPRMRQNGDFEYPEPTINFDEVD